MPTLVAERDGRAALRVVGLVASYGKVPVLYGVDVAAQAGEVVSIIGPNGAGKSTVLKSVMGYLKPVQGAIWLGETEITGLRPDRVVRRGIGYVPQGRVVFPQMTVEENLEMGGYTVTDKRQMRQTMERVFAVFPRLAERRRQLAATLSGGEQQMLAMGRALMITPRVMLMDEPSLGLAPRFVDLVFEKILALKASGLTVVLVEQNAARALSVSNRGYVLELGRNRFEGTGQQLLDDPRVRRLYLGGDEP